MPRDMVQVRRPQRHVYRAPEARIGRSQFNRSHGLKTTFDASRLVPFFCDEVLPGDTMTLGVNGFVRIFSPLDAPVMDNIECDWHFFFVPNRLVWDNWQYFQGEHDDAGAQDTSYTVPVLASGMTVDHDNGTAAANFLAYWGLPHGLQTGQVSVNCLPMRGYNLIYNEWFRDQNVTDSVTVDTGNGPDPSGEFALRKSFKKHDYFTTVLPYLQKGTAEVAVLTPESAEVTSPSGVAVGGAPSVYSDNVGAYRLLDADMAQVDLSGTAGSSSTVLYADLTDVGVNINTLRQSLAIQRSLERDARGGTRYTEIIKSRFGVTVPDYRVQRPEYLGGGSCWINITPVANQSDIGSATSASGADQYQGKLHGIGTGVMRGGGFAKSFTEHGYIIGIIRARGDLTYFQGLDRMWSRSTRYDFYEPDLAHLGEQSVLNKELFISNSSGTDDAVFGYQERWAEYRTKKSMLTGKFNPDVTGALSHWHVAEDFASLPTLNSTFLQDQTPMSRVTTVTTEPDFVADVWFEYKCARPLPVFSIPSIMPLRF